jgi:osmotically-inducible protein OsmY
LFLEGESEAKLSRGNQDSGGRRPVGRGFIRHAGHAEEGSVTLKGPVRSEEEKSFVEAKAKEIAGADKVTSEISIAPKKTKSQS